MGKKELSGRDNWQANAGKKAMLAERNLYVAFETYFEETEYILHRQPKHLRNLYTDVKLSDEILSEIYCPDIDWSKRHWGVAPDFAIENTLTKRILFGEIKRQDGWVEGGKPEDGRGNVHERACKLFSPGLIKTYRKVSGIKSEDILPFWVVFEGNITRDPKRVREITFWFDSFSNNFFMWRPNMTNADLIYHFEQHLKRYLDE